MRETKFQTQVKEALEEIGCLVFNVHGSLMQSTGWPDLWVGSPHWTGWIELKSENGGKPQGMQRVRIREMKRRSVPVWVLREVDEGRSARLEDLDGTVVGQVSWVGNGRVRGVGLVSALKKLAEDDATT